MKQLIHCSSVILFILILITSSNNAFSQSFPIKVAIYNDDGVGTGDPAKFEACITDTNLYKYTEVSGADIRAGILNNFDMLLVPGGSGSGQSASLQSVGLDSVRSFVYRGGGYYGTCGGAYLASAAYSWSLQILNAKAVDGAHWDRGHGPVVINFTSEGKEFYGIAQDTVTIIYWQGPLMAPGAVDTLPPYVKLSTFVTEIAENGAIPGAMIGSTAFAQSCFGKGRVIIHSPHPEMTTGLDYMVRAAVNWAANKSSFTKIATPLEATQWTAGTSQAIQWISGNGVDTMKINYSTDSGSTWTQISASTVKSFDWVVPNTPSTTCKLRINSTNRSGIGDTVSFTILPPLPTITSAASGSWNSTSTWNGGAIPDSLHDVIISSGHTVTLNSAGYCKNISFGDTTARLGMSANLYIYGNFNRYDTYVNPFFKVSWKSGAKMIFTGTAAEQTVTNLGATSTSPYPFSLNEVIINKPQGKFTTGTGNNYKLSIGTSLEVANGTFELGSTDDMEGRNVAFSSTYPAILIDSGAVFNMVGSSSYIRRGNFTSEENQKIGKMTIYGTAYMVGGSTNKISFTNIEVGYGGILYIPTGRGWVDSTFNPGTVTIRNGGTYRNGLSTTNIWYTNATTPTTFVLDDGGVFLTYSGTTIFPPNFTNNGTVRYAASSFDQTITDMNYSRLELSYTGNSYKKNWTLAASRNIADSLEINNSAILALSAITAQTLTINNYLVLRTGSLNNSNANISVSLANGATISRISGTITNTPAYAGSLNVKYEGASSISTGNELPTGSSTLNNLMMNNTGIVKLSANPVVNGALTLNGTLNLNGKILKLGSSTSAKGSLVYSSGHIIGTGTFTRWFDNSAIAPLSIAGQFPMGNTIADASAYISGTPSSGGTISVQFTDSTGTTEFSPVLNETGGLKINKRHNMGWTLSTGNGFTGNGFTLSVCTKAISSQSSNFITLPSNLDLVLSASLAPGTFTSGSGTNDSAFATRTDLTSTNLNNSFFIGSNADNALPVELSNFSSWVEGRNVNLNWVTATEVNAYKFVVQRSKSGDGRWLDLGEVIAHNYSNAPKSYSFIDKNLNIGKYLYQLKMIDNDGTYELSKTTVEATIGAPNEFGLTQNYPNPFNPTTIIKYALPVDAQVTLELYNIIGQKVATLINKTLSAGFYDYTVNMNSLNLASGMYIYKIVSRATTTGKQFTISKKMMYLK